MRKFFIIIWSIITAPFRFIRWIFQSIGRLLNWLVRKIKAFFTEEEEDTPLTEAMAKTVANPMSVMVHINALRKHLFRALIVMALTTAFSFSYSRQILELLANPLSGGITGLVAIDVTEPMGTLMKVSLLTGFALALPYIVFEVYLFIAPGVSPKSRLLGCLSIPVVVSFFLGGMAFAYYVLLPAAIPFLTSVMGITTQVRPSSYVSFTTGLLFWIGIAFEFPLVIFLLASMGIIKARALLNQWRLAIVIIAIMAALITPTIDPVNMSLVMGPMIFLYFLSIGLAFLAQRKRTEA